MITYTFDAKSLYGPVNGPYDDPDYVADCTDRERYGDEYDEPKMFEEPWAMYDP